MKDRIVIFIIGLLLGAIVATGSIYFYTVANSSCNNNNQIGMQQPNGQPPEMPNGENGQQGQPGQPPEMQNGNNTQNTNQTSSN